MKTIENKILKKVYLYETWKTLLEILLKPLVLIFLGLAVYVLGSAMTEVLIEQRSFDFLLFFREDFEVVKNFFLDSLYVLYLETPKFILFLFFAGLAGFGLLVLQIILNFKKIKNRVKSIFKYWRPH